MTDPSGKASILVVEDDAIIAWDIALQLRGLGYEPLGPARTGEQAITLAGRLRPRLVLMDVHLKGDMNGVAAAIAIRKQFDVPSVFLSAFTVDSSLAGTQSAQPAGYIAKPFTEQDLRSVVEAALGDRPSRLE